ncbi:putative agmatinase 2 [Glarea lozoyensis 74030]|uniref:Putative agmatinase 2 n=1 Tax=Glarea lozoyensis (strain ATCC 74030 / MF5533) TaxID=1104152 RepID=H0EWG2_GLAL7|nr:putative agmatinase 2 [Glarea lozoyensis 74030]
MSWAKILDCGDIPVTPMDNAMALTQMTSAYLELGNRAPLSYLAPREISVSLAECPESIQPRNVHAGLRTRLSGEDWGDYEDDTRQGFLRISSDDIDDIGPKGVIDAIMNRMGTEIPVYLSVDIDVIDPGLAPGTGTPEAGGWTTRELIRILRGIEGLNVVGADIVEVAPAYDGVGEQTALAGAQVAYEILTSIVKRGLVDMGKVAEVPGRKNLVTKDEL